jgi:antitoxin CptB
MSVGDRLRSRIRWRCRRGLLELDLVLHAFLERHLDGLDAAGLEALKSLLARSDPELLDLVLGRQEAAGIREREVLALMRNESCNALQHSN